MSVPGGACLHAGFIPLGGARRPPLFLVQDGHGAHNVFALVAERGNAGFPIYGLLAGALDRLSPHAVAGRAARLLETIRTIQPHGPYRLAAWPDCALVTYELGAQLVAQGQEVEFIGLVGDTVRADAHFHPPRPAAALRVHLFVGEGATAPKAGFMRWQELLPSSQLRIVRLFQCMRPDIPPSRALVRVLIDAVTEASRQRAAVRLARLENTGAGMAPGNGAGEDCQRDQWVGSSMNA